jgi:hypothetical protein
MFESKARLVWLVGFMVFNATFNNIYDGINLPVGYPLTVKSVPYDVR